MATLIIGSFYFRLGELRDTFRTLNWREMEECMGKLSVYYN
jgi:hypothetical protein